MSVFLFTILYKLISVYEYSKSSKKKEPKNSLGNHLWFSLITQSTVGYGSSSYEDMSGLKKSINMLQLSLFSL